MTKWLIIILLSIIFFVCMWVLGVKAFDCDPSFFFNGWELKTLMIGNYPLAAGILVNPDTKGKPSKVKIFLNLKEQTVDGYAYWENGELQIFFGEKYEKEKAPNQCYQCHKKPVPL